MDTLKELCKWWGINPESPKYPLDIPGGRPKLAQLFAALQFTVGAEVGVEQGEFTETLCKANPKVKLYAIDAWTHYRGYRDHVDQKKLDRFEAATRARLKPYPHVEVIKGWSMEVVRDFPEGSLDFVYIDSNHAFDFFMEDLINWSRRVRKGGIVAGHDFIRRGAVDVVPATQCYTYCHQIRPWFTTGGRSPENVAIGGGAIETRGWFWVKP